MRILDKIYHSAPCNYLYSCRCNYENILLHKEFCILLCSQLYNPMFQDLLFEQ